MWNMYATFEDLISASPSKNEKKNGKEMTNDGHTESVDLSANAVPKLDTFSSRDENMSKVSSKCFKVSMKSDENGAEKSKSVERVVESDKTKIEMNEMASNVRSNFFTRKMKCNSSSTCATTTAAATKSGYQSDSGSSSSVANPLLDTISSLTSSDPYSDSDDCCDLNGKAYQQRQRRRCRRMINERSMKRSPNHHHHHHSSSDADSIGYAGSNSIDSGYKSQCQTPEVPEGSTLAASEAIDRKQNACVSENVESKSDSNNATVITDNNKKMSASKVEAVTATKEDVKVTTVPSSCAASAPKSRSPVKDLRRTLNTSPTLSAANNKSVRFDNDVQITSLYPLTLNARTSLKARRKIETAAEFNERSPFATKSILKDPLCANLRTQIETGELGSGCSLEGEIDTLLYGKVDANYSNNYQLDVVHDIPYVSLIEDKYRLKQNAANVTKMKASEVNINATLSTKTRERASYSSGTAISDRSSKLSKSKFTEMAKYMLDILDDLQTKKGDDLKSSIQSTVSNKKVSDKHIYQDKSKASQHSDTASEASYNTLPEYHIYEEVLYDCMNSIKHDESRVQFNEPEKTVSKVSDLHTPIEKMIPGLKSTSTAGSWGRRSYNRPKQRSNLYSLFTDSAQRRSISRSLEREWNYYRSNLIEDIDICKEKEMLVADYCGEYRFKASV
ncbi:hypothetical protein B4U80_05262 [Leptotrombidium deliense]|uniref:Uncharacterized protein n=1 Tax=Leptotrombidium deliense TaxID=299467 RepID=A0A443SV10_9ACAR|nr:hypothetical protein B4U80_05262 [Leptotrombidium deliense]